MSISNITPANRTGNGSFRINATANTGTAQRVGTVAITAPGATTRTILVTQAVGRTVTLNPNGGVVNPTSLHVTPGTPIGNIPTPFRQGHNFRGWFDAQTGGTQVLPSRIIHNNMTIFARWNVIITLNPNGGSVIPTSVSRDGGTHMGVLPIPTRAGFQFEGWYTSVTGGTRVLPNTVVPHNNITLFARWSLIWHSDDSWVGFWPASITVSSMPTIRGEVPTGFALATRLTESRPRWVNALGVNIGTTSHANASIQVYGGSLEEMQEESRNFGNWAGLAIYPTRTRAGTVTVNNITRTVYRFSGQSRIFITYGAGLEKCLNPVCTTPIRCPACPPEPEQWTAGMVRGITVHELGHALGFAGHAPSRTDVMYRQLQRDTQGNISANEARHLRQIYDAFRPPGQSSGYESAEIQLKCYNFQEVQIEMEVGYEKDVCCNDCHFIDYNSYGM